MCDNDTIIIIYNPHFIWAPYATNAKPNFICKSQIPNKSYIVTIFTLNVGLENKLFYY